MQAKLLDDKSILVKVAPDDARYADMLRKLQGGAGTDEQEADGDDTHEDIQPIADSEETSERGEEPSESADEDTKDLAEFYANHWNHMAAAGMEPNEESLWDAEDELEDGEWSVYLDEDDGTWKVAHISTFDVPRVRHDRNGQPLRYAWVDHGHSATGKKRWKNSETGRIAYQEKKPGDKSGRSKVLRDGPGEPRPEGALSAKDKKAAEKSLEALKKASKGGAKAKLGKMASELRTAAQTIPASKVRDRKRIEKQIKMVEHQLELLGAAKEPMASVAVGTQTDAVDTAKLAARANLLAEAALIVGKSVKAMVKYSDEQLRAIIDNAQKETDHDKDELERGSGEDREPGDAVRPPTQEPLEPMVPGSGEAVRGDGRPGGVHSGDGLSGAGQTGDDGGTGNGLPDSSRTGDGGTPADATGRRGSRKRPRRGDEGSPASAGGEPLTPSEESFAEEPTASNPTDLAAGNFRYVEDMQFSGAKSKFHNNMAAIGVLRLMESEGRTTATPEEQTILSKWVGWGQIPQLFAGRHYGSNWGNHDLENEDGSTSSWKAEREQFESMVSKEEWDAARQSTTNAHYTHPDVVKLHWNLAQKLGFDGGRFLETSAGIGYYLGMMPDELRAKTKVSAVEKDKLTGDMLARLYPSYDVNVKGFEEVPCPDNFYDLVASNVPFGNYPVFDPKYDKKKPAIHDYFFLKSADTVRPGGLVMHITSDWTMDKADDRIRRELDKNLELVSAVRFPSKAHSRNAGTDVVTDLLIFRKKDPSIPPIGEETPAEAKPSKIKFTGITTDSLGRLYHWKDGKRVPAADWLGTTTIPDPRGGEPMVVNNFFAENPQNVLGTIDRSGEMRAADQKSCAIVTAEELSDSLDRRVRAESHGKFFFDDTNERVPKEVVDAIGKKLYEKKLGKFIDSLPHGVMRKNVVVQASESSRLAAPGEVKPGSLTIQDGKVYLREGSELVEQQLTKKQISQVQSAIEIRDTLRESFLAQSNGEDASAIRERLNTLYDAYVKAYGRFNEKGTAKNPKSGILLGVDVNEYPVWQALEHWDAETKTAAKADVFFKDTIRSDKKIEHADSVNSALGIVLNESGSIDMDRIASLVGTPKAKVAFEMLSQGLAYRVPGGGWEPADQYLSGNVRRKLMEARAAMKLDAEFEANVKALEKVQPADVSYSEISVRLGAAWLDPEDMKSFAASVVGSDPGAFHITHSEQMGWTVAWNQTGRRNYAEHSGAAKRWYVERNNGRKAADLCGLLEMAMNNKAPFFKTEDEVDKVAIEMATGRIDELKEKFDQWIWKDADRRDRLSRYYNDNFNNIVPLQFDGSHLTLPGSSPDVELRPHQKNFIWRTTCTGVGLAGHEVGTGKTFALIGSAMELRRLGLARKPAIVCLKANVETITKDAQKMYPNAKIISTLDNFSDKQRKKTAAQIATGDYDIIVMTHNNLDMLPMRPETVKVYIQAQLDELDAVLDEAIREATKNGGDVERDPTVKELAKKRERLVVKLKKAIEGSKKDNSVYFEDTGIDTILVDEAHKYKSLPLMSLMGQIKGIPNTNSDRAINMHMRTDWLHKKNNGRGVIFATGTPVSNTLAELYIMQKYLQPNELKERGLDSFDSWASAFGTVTTEMEFSATGEYKDVTRFKKYVNVNELMNMTRQVLDVQRLDMLVKDNGEKQINRLPKVEQAEKAPYTSELEAFMGDLQDRAKNLDPRDRKADNMLKICTDGRKASIDMRLVDPDAVDDPASKVNLVIDNVMAMYQKHPDTTQMIFSELGVNPIDVGSGGKRFHLYQDIIDKLVKRGVKPDEIADFTKLDGEDREDAMQGMRDGKVRIAIGSTERLGTGVNVQDRLAAIHHLDVPWTPAALEQREGRGWRQGNANSTGEFRVFKYATEKSLDVLFWNTIARKKAFIDQVMSPATKGVREVDDVDTEAISPEEMVAFASGDDRVVRKITLDNEIKILTRKKRYFEQDKEDVQKQIRNQEDVVRGLKGQADEWAGAMATVEALPKDFSMQISGVTYDNTADAQPALENAISESVLRGGMDHGIGKYKGLDVRFGAINGLYVRMPGGMVIQTGKSTQALATTIGQIPNRAAKWKESLEFQERKLEEMKSQPQSQDAWPMQGLLDEKIAESKRLENELKGVAPKPEILPINDGDENDGDEPMSTLGWNNLSPDIRPIADEPDRYARDAREFVIGRQSYTELIRYQRRMRTIAASAGGG